MIRSIGLALCLGLLAAGSQLGCTVFNGLGTYEDVIRNDKPAGFWQFAETSGTDVHNDIAGGRDCSLKNGATFGGADISSGTTAVSMTGKGSPPSAIDCGSNYAFETGSGFSLEAWINPAEIDSIQEFSSHIVDVGGGRKGYFAYTNKDSGGNLRVDAYDNDFLCYAQAHIDTNVFTHVVVTHDESKLTLYTNGAPHSVMCKNAIPTPSSQPFVMGAVSSYGCCGFNGRIDQAAVYGYALTPAQVLAHFQAR